MALKAKYQQFAHQYLKLNRNAFQAAVSVGYKERGALSAAHRLLNMPRVADYIRQLEQNTQYNAIEKAGETEAELRAKIIDEWKMLAFSNIKNYLNGQNIPIELKDLPDNLTAAIESVGTEVRPSRGGDIVNYKLKMYSKIDALRELGRLLGMYEADNLQKQPQINLTHLNVTQIQQLILQLEQGGQVQMIDN